MNSAMAFLGAILIVTTAQSFRWRLGGSRRAGIRWHTYMRSSGAWLGWPIVAMPASYMLLELLGIAITR